MISDRIDIQVEIEPVEFDDMATRQPAESSTSIVLGRHIAEAIGYRALDRPANFGLTF